MSLSIDTTKAARSHADQEALVSAVYRAPASAQETDWLEWKGPLELAGSDARGRAAVAKAVLGFANRNPDSASRNMTGCAYFLAGVSPGELSGVEPVDAATLEGQVGTYVGPDIGWRADYVVLEERSVLVVTVEAPQWGDPPRPVRKTFNPESGGPRLQEGTIYVRHQASTEQATAADIDMLGRRAARRGGEQLELDLRVMPGSTLRAVELGQQARTEYIEREKSRLLAPLSPAGRMAASVYVKGAMFDREQRTEGDYLEEVRDYLECLDEELVPVLCARAVSHDAARLKLEMVNNTDMTFTGVRVEMRLPAELAAVDSYRPTARESEPPSSPIEYGTPRMRSTYGFGVPSIPSAIAARMINPIKPIPAPNVERRADGFHVMFQPVDVRAQGPAQLRSVWLVVDAAHGESVPVQWEATATNAQGRLSGTLNVPLTHPPMTIDDLLDELPPED